MRKDAAVKIERILCPIDFSELSNEALEYGISLSRRYKAKLYLQHVVEPVTLFSFYGFPGWREMYEDFKASAEGAVRELINSRVAPEGVQPEIDVRVGAAAESILKLAEQKGADLIVMATHGRRGMDRFALGSVIDKVMRKSKCPVFAVRRPAPNQPEERGFEPKDDGLRLKQILVASDFSQHAYRALAYALSLATEYRAGLTMLHVLETVPQDKDLQSETERLSRELETSLPDDARSACSAKIVVRVGKPYREIVQVARESRADLIVLGGRGRSAWVDMAIFGSTTHRVLQLGPCSVLAVHIQTTMAGKPPGSPF